MQGKKKPLECKNICVIPTSLGFKVRGWEHIYPSWPQASLSIELYPERGTHTAVKSCTKVGLCLDITEDQLLDLFAPTHVYRSYFTAAGVPRCILQKHLFKPTSFTATSTDLSNRKHVVCTASSKKLHWNMTKDSQTHMKKKISVRLCCGSYPYTHLYEGGISYCSL